jgi:ABC-type sugar transport system substrate-binding protein
MSAEYFNQLEPGSKVIALKSTTIFAGKARLEGFKEALEGEIPFEREINLEDPVGETTKAVQDALVSNPDATGVWPEYDSFTQSAAAAVQREGKDLPVLGYFASPENVKSMTSGGLIKAIVETNISKGATMCLDQFLKHFEKGTPINKNALKEAGGLEYEVITAEEIGEHLYPGLSESANVDHVNPPGAILKPFLASWAKEYPAK